MPPPIVDSSVGLVQTQIVRIPLPPEGLRLECGRALRELQVAYETYGTLSPAQDNVIFVCHALSGDAHVAGYHDPSDPKRGWWDEMVGPGKGIDTAHYHVVCANILGGCKGTTGPSSPDPATGKPYGSSFPPVTVADIVAVHCLLLKSLGISRLAAVIGGSFGGMQVLEWTIRHPEMIDRAICIASATSLSAQALAFDIVGRRAITYDPDWQHGDYYGTGAFPARGLSLARKVGHITYLSPTMMTKKFGREKQASAGATGGEGFRTDFQVESYLEHQGRKFVERFDANSYLHITHAMDVYDLEDRYGSLEKAFASIRAKYLVVALSADWLFPPEQSEEIATALLRAGKSISYCKLHAPHGHDAFLVDIEHLAEVIRAFLPWVKHPALPRPPAPERSPERTDEYNAMASMIAPGSRVLDLGCGNGDLLSLLAARRQIRGIGVDIDIGNVIDVLDKGHDIFEDDIDAGLAIIPDGAYDYAILSETLQVVHKPRQLLHEMLRVAREGIVTFPNFGLWRHRLHLAASGRMPKSEGLPFDWYNTPNIHLFTLRDFVELCQEDRIMVREIRCFPCCAIGRILVRMGCRNLGSDRVLVRIGRA